MTKTIQYNNNSIQQWVDMYNIKDKALLKLAKVEKEIQQSKER